MIPVTPTDEPSTRDRQTSRLARLDQKVAGVMIPLFSIRTKQNFGSGEILDLIPFVDWMTIHHLRVLQILPIYETAPDETSPYQALSSFAIDPAYLSVSGEQDFQDNADIEDCLASETMRHDLAEWQSRDRVDLKPIRTLKYQLLKLAFFKFKHEEWDQKTPQAQAFQEFIDEKSVWLNDYALFWQLKRKHQWAHWCTWPPPFQHRDPEALDTFEEEAAEDILFIKYVQWILSSQWSAVSAHAKAHHINIMGDLPFLVSQDSADVWCRQERFHRHLSVGAPPDDFSSTGQDWGLPLFNWDIMQAQNLEWWRLRIREAAKTYAMIRLDHVVGFFRVWVISKEHPPSFDPPHEHDQIERGKALLSAILQEAGECIPIAEDLGCIPDFVRYILSEFQIPGHKILRWEKQGEVYIHPRDYPKLSLATTGTHDTSSLLIWWHDLSLQERQNVLGLLNAPANLSSVSPLPDLLHHKIIDLLLESASLLVIFPIQDLLLEEARINTPATVGPHNWCYRLPVDLSALDHTSPYQERLLYLTEAIKRFQRAPDDK